MIRLNQLNEKLRIIRVQIMAEEGQVEPDMERLEILRKEEEDCLKQLQVI